MVTPRPTLKHFLIPVVLLTLIQVVLLHGVDKVRPGVEVVGPWLLEPPQAEEAPPAAGAAGEGPPAGDAGVPRPAVHLQVQRLQCRHRQFPLTTACRIRGGGGQSPPSIVYVKAQCSAP